MSGALNAVKTNWCRKVAVRFRENFRILHAVLTKSIRIITQTINLENFQKFDYLAQNF